MIVWNNANRYKSQVLTITRSISKIWKIQQSRQYGVYSPPGNSNVTKESEKQLKWPMKFKWPVTYPNIYSETSK